MPYNAPTTVAEAAAFLAERPDARVFAGATDMLPQARAGRPLPQDRVDLKKIPRLVSMAVDADGWTIGAAAPASRVAGDEGFRAEYPGIAEAVALIGSDQIQSRASIGGNLCNASPAADSGPAMAVNGAMAVIASSAGERTLPVVDLPLGPGRTSLREGEFVVEFLIPRRVGRRSDAYVRFTPRTEMDIAVVGAGATIEVDAEGVCTDAAVVLGAVAPTIVSVDGVAEVLAGTMIDEGALARVAALAGSSGDPIDDKRGTADYRRHLAGVIAVRAVRTAAERARSLT